MSEAKKFRLLVIEDNPGDIELLKLALEGAALDCELEVFQHGGEALCHVRSFDSGDDRRVPDLAVIDINLPQNDGIQVLEAMRGIRALADVPVVVFSSSSMPAERARLDAFAITRFIAKPADLEAVLEIGPLLREILMRPSQS